MSEAQNCSSSVIEEKRSTPDILMTENDDRFFRSLDEFIDQEKRNLQVPEEGPDEVRYTIYRYVFSKVIERTTSYKRLLLLIKAEYDDVVMALQRRAAEARTTQRTLTASTSHPKNIQRRADHLRERIRLIQKETSELQEETERQKSSVELSTWIPGLTEAESKDPDALDRHLEHLEAYRAALLDRKSPCVSLEVSAERDVELQTAEEHRDLLSTKNKQLKVLYKRLRLVSDCLSTWETVRQRVPLEEVLSSTLQNFREISVTDDDGRIIDVELFEHEEPTGVDESKLLTDHLGRFMELFDSAQYEEAALLAARSPRGVLRNLDTMEMFKGVKGPRGSLPPPLLFLEALLMTVAAGETLPAAVSLQLVHCSLQHGHTQLIAHAINNNKLTFSEDMGDVLTAHAQTHPGVADLCLAFATIIYEAARLDRKVALTMCQRGLIHSAADFMNHCQDLTAEDCMWVLCQSPSLTLLQLLTAPQQGRAAILSMGVACFTLLAKQQQQHHHHHHHLLALQLLDSLVSRGRGVLEQVMLQDSRSSVDEWTVVASRCSELNRPDLSRAVRSVLLGQSGTGVQSPDLEGGRLMEHVFL